MKAFITITGLKFHFGSKPFAVGQKVKLVKEPDNEYDSEALLNAIHPAPLPKP